MFNQLCGRIKLILLGVIGALRRALCCFSRRRKPSETDCEILQSVSVIQDTGKSNNDSQKDWNSWDDSPRTVQEHIEQYRQRLVKPPTPTAVEPEPDFFQDMTPQIKPQLKILIKGEAEPVQTDFSRLKATSDIPIPMAPDLQDWNEEDTGGWEDLDADATKKLIREKQKELRAQKQAKPKNPALGKPMMFAERMGAR